MMPMGTDQPTTHIWGIARPAVPGHCSVVLPSVRQPADPAGAEEERQIGFARRTPGASLPPATLARVPRPRLERRSESGSAQARPDWCHPLAGNVMLGTLDDRLNCCRVRHILSAGRLPGSRAVAGDHGTPAMALAEFRSGSQTAAMRPWTDACSALKIYWRCPRNGGSAILISQTTRMAAH